MEEQTVPGEGENSTIGDSGCGPTAAAMLLSTLTGKNITPEDTCKWSVDHGYKALDNGTYYAYFGPAVCGLRYQVLATELGERLPQP